LAFPSDYGSHHGTVGGVAADLDPDIQATFLGGADEVGLYKLERDETYYRVFSSPERIKGDFLTTVEYSSSSQAIRELALREDFGNKATDIVNVVVPAGTYVYRGRAAPQHPSSLYPGGGPQVYIPNAHTNPAIQWNNPRRIGP
jgi:hypothetical protein